MGHKYNLELLRCWVWHLLVILHLGDRERRVTFGLQLALRSCQRKREPKPSKQKPHKPLRNF